MHRLLNNAAPALQPARSAGDAPPSPSTHRLYRLDVLSLAGVAIALRLVFATLAGDTYDYDEFVVLLLGRAVAGGARVYRDFMFFHPPGALVVFAAIHGLTDLWWPLGRLFTVLVDTGTSLLVARVGVELFGRRAGLAAGLVYAASPLALVSAGRVGQDSLITLLGMAGLTLLVCRSAGWAAVLAGVCLGLAIWIKYPALYFAPVYLLAAPRRVHWWAGGALATCGVAFIAFAPEAEQLWQQTVTFQRSRWSMPFSQRLGTGLIFWLAVNPLAVVGLARTRAPLWLKIAFLLGGVFLLSTQVYYHYFVPVAPVGALLSAPLAANYVALSARAALAGLAIAVSAAEVLQHGGSSPLYVTAAHLSHIRPTIAVLDGVPRNRRVLADRFEYAYLADRPGELHYFWNVGVLVDAGYLERHMRGVGAVVLSYGASSGFPRGFIRYLDRHYPATHTPANTVWLTQNTRRAFDGPPPP